MKNLLMVAFGLFICQATYAQGNNQGNANSNANAHWKINGNVADTMKYIGTNNAAPLIFKTNYSESMRISADGDIGIGVKNPTMKLDIGENVRFRKDIKIDTLKNGNPGDKVVVVDNQGILKGLSASGIVSGIYQYSSCIPKTDGNGNALYPAPVWTNDGGSDAGILYTGGECPAYVGIGLENPDVPLHVIGDAKITGTLKVGVNSIYFGGLNQSTGNNNTIYATGDLEIQSDPNNSYNTVINANNPGNVGIGISTPGYKLDVAGTIRACKLIAEANSWCDYVFEEDYELMSIEEVEAYIAEHGHLPGIPSQEEVEENGVDVVDMEARLLKKIEELTLYVIELDKKNKALESQLGQISDQK